MLSPRLTLAILTLLLALSLSALAADAEPAFRKLPEKVKAAALLAPTPLQGPSYSVAGSASCDGLVASFQLETDWGTFEVVGADATQQRVHEVEVTLALEAMKRSAAFKDSFKKGVLAPVEATKSVVTEPVKTVSGAVTGFGRWVGNVGTSALSDDPDQEGAVSALVGYAGARRAYAVRFGVDPWTDFEPLQERLREIAQASVAASLTVKVGMAAIPATDWGYAIKGLGMTDQMNRLLADNPAARIRKLNQEALETLGIPGHQAEGFVRNYNYTPAQQALLIKGLEEMGPVSGREIFVSHATAAPDGDAANFMMLRAQMMGQYARRHGAADVVSAGGFPWLKTVDNTLVVTLPNDCLLWTPALAKAMVDAEAAIAKMGNIKASELWFEGRVDSQAREQLEERGWTVKEDVKLTPRSLLR